MKQRGMDTLICIDDIKSMSPETFQDKLWLWFKENGVVSEIKAHIRRQMLRAIKNTDFINKDILIDEGNVNVNNQRKEFCNSAIHALNGTKSVKHCKAHNDEDDANNLIQMVYEDLQVEFDKEIKIAKMEEHEKFDNLTKVQEEKFAILLLKEKEKFKRKEYILKKKLRKELVLERQKMLENENLKELENERNLQIDLEKERTKLMEECRKMAESKNANNVSIIEIQQRSLEIGLKAVQRQSNRLRKKEEKLNKKMTKLAHNEVRHKNVSYQTTTDSKENSFKIPTKKDILSYNKTTQTDTNELRHLSKTVNEVVCQTNIIENRSVECQTKYTGNVEQYSKDVQTINCYNSIACQTECFDESEQLKVNSNVFLNRFKEMLQSEDLINDEKECANSIFNKEYSLSSSEESSIDTPLLNISIDTLKEDNSRLKLYNSQQREHIKQLSMQQVSLSKEIMQSNKEIRRLSDQLALLKSGQINVAKFSESISKCENSPNKEYTDIEFDKLKEKIRILERESDENDKSYFEIKRQLENCTKQTFVTPKSLSNYSSSVSDVQIKSLIDVRSSEDFFEGARNKRRDAKHIYGALNHSNLNNAKPEQIYDLNTSIKANILQNYLTTSSDFSKYNMENPKLFADMLLQRNIHKNLNHNANDYSKLKTRDDIFEKYISSSNPKEKFKCPKRRTITSKQKVMELSNENKQHFILKYELEQNKEVCDKFDSNETDFELVLKKNKDYKNFHYDMKKKEIVRRWSLSPSNKNGLLQQSVSENECVKEKKINGKRIKFSQRKILDKNHNKQSSEECNNGQVNEPLTIASKYIQEKKIATNNQSEVKNIHLINPPEISSESSIDSSCDLIKTNASSSRENYNGEEKIVNNLLNDSKNSEENKGSEVILPNKDDDNITIILDKNTFDSNNEDSNINHIVQVPEQSNDTIDIIIDGSVNSINLMEHPKTHNEEDDMSDLLINMDNMNNDENLKFKNTSSSKNVSESEVENSSNSVSAPHISDDNASFWN